MNYTTCLKAQGPRVCRGRKLGYGMKSKRLRRNFIERLADIVQFEKEQ
jgi:hypothetical protein